MSDVKAALFAGSLDPLEALAYYRQNSSAKLKADVEKFNQMSSRDRQELLFWVVLNLNMAVGACLMSDEDDETSRH